MRKAIMLQVTLWIQGEDEPAHDFAKSTIKAVRDVISAGAKAHPELRFKVTKVIEKEDD
jgi:hypothetical protein